MKNILFIDDDKVTHNLVKLSLGNEFNLISTYSIQQAWAEIEKNSSIHAFIIDRHLPDGDGIDLCFKIRQLEHYSATPVIFLTSAGAELEKVSGFFAGADDYVVKPFGPMELKARIQSKFKTDNSKIRVGDIEIDLKSHRAYSKKDGQLSEIDLTRTELKILTTLAQSLDRVFDRELLLSKVWGQDTHVTDRVVDSHVSHLRKKIAGSQLELSSLRGEGYRLTLKSNKGSSSAA